MHFWDHHKNITLYYELLTKSVCDKYDLKQMEYDTLMFLYYYPQFNTAADIVKIRKSTKSHVSTSLKVLEEKGLIEKSRIGKIKSVLKFLFWIRLRLLLMMELVFKKNLCGIFLREFPKRRWILLG